MKKIIILLLLGACLIPNFINKTYANSFELGIAKDQYLTGNRVIDKTTGLPIIGALIQVPSQNYTSYTDENGYFTLNAKLSSPVIVLVKKDGYRDFSTTLLPNETNRALSLSLIKEDVNDIKIECELCHLGDDSFSPNSANSNDFKTKSTGPFYSKTFKMSSETSSKTNFLVIGSIIGIDTMMAKRMGQNKIPNSYASAPEVYFNGKKIAEIQLNGDNQRIKLPQNIIRFNSMNEITIKTGHNMSQLAHLDYDDIEFINLSIQSE